MKKILIAVLITAVIVGAFFSIYQKQDVAVWGTNLVATTVTVADTTSLATAHSLVSYAGQGRLKRIFFNSSSATVDCSVSVAFDGITAEKITEPTSEEVTSYVVLNNVPSSTGADTYFKRADSTAVLSPQGLDMDIPFRNNLTVTFWSATAATVVRCCVVYERID